MFQEPEHQFVTGRVLDELDVRGPATWAAARNGWMNCWSGSG